LHIYADEKSKKKECIDCLSKQSNCKARFSRPTFDETKVDPKTGALNIKKDEKCINTFTPELTFFTKM